MLLQIDRQIGVRNMPSSHLSRDGSNGGDFMVGDFVVEPQRNVLRLRAVELAEADGAGNRPHETAPSDEIRLEPKVMDVLCALAERPGEVVPRQDLIDRVWGVHFGGDESLTRSVCVLRRKFSSLASGAYIETVPKRGYRLVAPVRELVEPAMAQPDGAPERGALRRPPGLAVVLAIILACVLAALAVWRSPSARLFSAVVAGEASPVPVQREAS